MTNRTAWLADCADQDFAQALAEWFDDYCRFGPGVAHDDAAQALEALAASRRERQSKLARRDERKARQ